MNYLLLFLLVCTVSFAENGKEHNRSDSTVWERLSPTPKKYDWIELISGEWLKGKFKGMHDKALEFDSKKLKLQTFDFEDIKQIKTYRIVNINLQNPNSKNDGLLGLRDATVSIDGILHLNGSHATIVQDDATYEIDHDRIISIAVGGESELSHWSGKITLNLNLKSGNTELTDYSAQAKILRRTGLSRLRFDYIGAITTTNGVESSRNHRLGGKFDLFLTQRFFLTPIAAEYYQDIYQNIASQITLGAGFGYTIFNKRYLKSYVVLRPSYVYTDYHKVQTGESLHHESYATELDIFWEKEKIRERIDLTFDYKFTKLDSDSGRYRHHMITKAENKITKWLDIDFTFIWDYIDNPKADENGIVPTKSDFQFLVGLGIKF